VGHGSIPGGIVRYAGCARRSEAQRELAKLKRHVEGHAGLGVVQELVTGQRAVARRIAQQHGRDVQDDGDVLARDQLALQRNRAGWVAPYREGGDGAQQALFAATQAGDQHFLPRRRCQGGGGHLGTPTLPPGVRSYARTASMSPSNSLNFLIARSTSSADFAGTVWTTLGTTRMAPSV